MPGVYTTSSYERHACRARRRPRGIGLMAATAVIMVSTAEAAPLPPSPPVDVCGVIVEQSWVPAESLPGQKGFSGSLGHDRTFPAHLRIVLENYTGIDATVARRINGFLNVTGLSEMNRLALRLPTDNPELLRDVRRLCIEGFTIRGDEGGTWTTYRRLAPAQ
jgi:hypothetical protein